MDLAEFTKQMREQQALLARDCIQRIRVTGDADRRVLATQRDEHGKLELVMHPLDWQLARRGIPVLKVPSAAYRTEDAWKLAGIPVVFDS